MSRKGAKILCVDDDQRNLRLLEGLLLPEGYELIFALSGEEALAKVLSGEPELMLLDIIMPGMSGLEVLARLRSDMHTRLLPVVLLTALRDEDDRIKGIEAGCDDFISKPFDRAELLARVRTLLKITFYRRALDEKEKFETVIRQMSEGVIVCDPQGVVVNINDSARKYFDLHDGQKANFFDLVFKEYFSSICRDAVMDFSSGHRNFDLIRVATSKFKPLYLEVNLDVLKNSQNEICNIIFTVRDVSDLREKDRLKQDFLGVISHKLRTPVSVISGDIALIQDEVVGPLNEKQRKFIGSAYKGTVLLQSLIEKLIKFAEINQKTVDPSREKVVISAYLEDFAKKISDNTRSGKVELTIDCPDKELVLDINRDHLKHILNNLVENSAKFTDLEVAKVNISVHDLPREVEIVVSDNGRGIPAEEHERIFQGFYQVENHLTGQIEGIGLGLALVKRLMDACFGRIQMRSRIGEGTTFTLSFPK